MAFSTSSSFRNPLLRGARAETVAFPAPKSKRRFQDEPMRSAGRGENHRMLRERKQMPRPSLAPCPNSVGHGGIGCALTYVAIMASLVVGLHLGREEHNITEERCMKGVLRSMRDLPS